MASASATIAVPTATHQTKRRSVSGRRSRSLIGWVRKARHLGASWARVGETLGMTRQSAWERFSGED